MSASVGILSQPSRRIVTSDQSANKDDQRSPAVRLQFQEPDRFNAQEILQEYSQWPPDYACARIDARDIRVKPHICHFLSFCCCAGQTLPFA
jgi:hypothetical protein